jgi:hypothetical protein
MSMYWAFQLDGVADQCQYLDRIRDTNSFMELDRAIRAFQYELQTRREWEDIPL